MNNHIHHVHIFASDLNKTIKFYEDSFDGKIVLDTGEMGTFYLLPKKESMRGAMERRTIYGSSGFIEKVRQQYKFNAVIKRRRGRPRKQQV